jgi:DNA topoisomerase-3
MMERGELQREQFMGEIKELTKHIVEQTRDYNDEIINRVFPDLDAPCPECHAKTLKQTDGTFECKDPECSFRLKKHIASHELTEAEAKSLVTDLKVGPIDSFKNRFGSEFTAELILEKPKKVWKVNFVFEGDAEREDELKNLSDDQILCEVPKAADSDELIKVYETDRAFLAPDMATDADDRGVRVSKTILQKDIPTEQAVKLFMEGKTDLMPDFVSKKKGRKFAAHLTLDKESGKIGFEFAPAKKKKKAAKKKAADSDETDSTTDESDNKTPAKKKKAAAKKKPAKKKTAKKKSKSADD